MASYTLTAGQFAAHAKTLVASTVDTVTFPADRNSVEVISHDGAAPIYFTVDGSTPTVGGAATHLLPAAICSRDVALKVRADAAVVKLISVGTPTYSVVGS